MVKAIMSSLPFRFAAETYTWFMKDEGRAHAGQIGHMIQVTARAGFAGFSPSHSWMGDYFEANRLEPALKDAGLQLAAIALVLPWNLPEETARERTEADATIALLKRFSGATLCMVQLPEGRHDLELRQRNLVANLNTVARRAAKAGVPASFHPNSPPHSTNRTESDYRAILERLDASVTGWTPDVGHIANGGMDPLQKMKEYAPLINLVHYKDWDGNPDFALMGRGKVDLVGVTQWLLDRHYAGWIVCEDEAHQAIEDPDGVTMHDGQWIKKTLIPALKPSA
jgi:inosose dehydratase